MKVNLFFFFSYHERDEYDLKLLNYKSKIINQEIEVKACDFE